MNYLSTHSPIGDITLFADSDKITSLKWGRVKNQKNASDPLLKEAVRQLNAYFTLHLLTFDLPLAALDTSFQKDVCMLISDIPYGKTCTYQEIATRLNTSPRPVGNACSRNPIPIFIPCHRIVGARDLGGYSGPKGIETKYNLLRLEGAELTDSL